MTRGMIIWVQNMMMMRGITNAVDRDMTGENCEGDIEVMLLTAINDEGKKARKKNIVSPGRKFCLQRKKRCLLAGMFFGRLYQGV